MGTGRRVCVFAGSRAGVSPEHAKLAGALGQTLARAGFGVVYGGGSTGLMGVLARATLAAGGEVLGVIPSEMESREWAFHEVTRLFITEGMHERKAQMAELSEAFVALPGGIGTLEELFEVFTWSQLGFHRKPVMLLDAVGYYTPLLTMLDRMVDEGFLGAEARRLLLHARSPADVLGHLSR